MLAMDHGIPISNLSEVTALRLEFSEEPDPILSELFVRLIRAHELASFLQRLLRPCRLVSFNSYFQDVSLTLWVQTQLKSFPFLTDAAMKWMSGPSQAQCLSPSFTIQAMSGSFAISAESNQVRYIA
jgi:hypothetical protein